MPNNLSTNQQRSLDMYVNQYNQTYSQIERLRDMLEEISYNILTILSSPRNSNRPYRNYRRRNNNNNNSRVINDLFNQRQNNYIHYDYNNPINPNLYNDNILNNNASRSNNNNSNNNNNNNNNSQRHESILSNPQNATNGYLNDFIRGFNYGFNNFFNSNVIVRPSQQQIQNASRIVRYGDIQDPLSESCPITLERFNPDDIVRQIHSCGHIFCQTAFNEWFASNVRCPVCRYDIRNYTNNSDSTTTQPTNQNSSVVSEDVSSDSEQENTNQENTNTNQENTNTNQENTNTNQENTNTNTNRNAVNSIAYNDDILNAISHRLLQSIFNPNTNNENNDRFMFDASNNVLFYETILRPSNNNNLR
jgi:hypothetical protein